MPELLVGEQMQFKNEDRKIIAFGELEIAVFNVKGDFHAYLNDCAHRGGPVCQGKILGKVEEVLAADKTSRGLRFSDEHTHIVCPWHGYEYNLKTGVNAGDKRVRLKKYEVTLREGRVYVIV